MLDSPETPPNPLPASDDSASWVITTSISAGALAKARSRAGRSCLRVRHALGMETEGARHHGVVGVLQRRPHDPPAVVHLLIEAFDIPGGVVGDDEDSLGVVALGRVDLHGIDAEGAVARDHHDLPSGAGQGGGDAVRNPDAQAAEGARIEVGPGREDRPAQS